MTSVEINDNLFLEISKYVKSKKSLYSSKKAFVDEACRNKLYNLQNKKRGSYEC